MKTIIIKHQVENTEYEFQVKDPANLTKKEVKHICSVMNIQALFVSGKYYRGENLT